MSDDGFCEICQTHFSSAETLAKHTAAIHKKAAPAPPADAASSGSSAKRARDDEQQPDAEPPSENVELAPLLGVLSDAQKESLILHAVQRDPSFYELILEQAQLPLTDDAADARIEGLGPEGVASAVRWYLEAGSAPNALTMLLTASQRALAALEELAGLEPGAAEAGSAGSAGAAAAEQAEEGGWQSSGELAAVEGLPSAGALGALWVEALARKALRSIVGADGEGYEQTRLMLEALQSAAATVRGFAPAVLLGPEGQKVELLAQAVEALDAAYAEAGARLAKDGKKKARKA
jgi:hypothetical protein